MNSSLADNKLLTGSAVAATNVAKTSGFGQHTLYIMYSPDTDSTNAMEVTIETSPDGTTWFPFTGEYSNSVGTVTPGTPLTLSFASAGTADDPQEPFTFFVNAEQIRIKALETNSPGDFGNYSAWLISTH